MANMSYCRFENTADDVKDCVEAIQHGKAKDLNEYETQGIQSLVQLARQIVELADNDEIPALDNQG